MLSFLYWHSLLDSRIENTKLVKRRLKKHEKEEKFNLTKLLRSNLQDSAVCSVKNPTFTKIKSRYHLLTV